MKKVLLLSTAFLFLLSLSANAQYGVKVGLKDSYASIKFEDAHFDHATYATNDGVIALGLMAGMNLASVSDSNGDGLSGFHAGVFAVIAFSELFAIMPELYFSTQGDKAGSSEINLSYIYIPILLRIHLLAGLYALVGPQFGFNLKSESKFSGSGTIDESEFTNGLDVGAVVGAMYQFLRFHAYVRYVIGLNNIYDFSGADQKNRLFQFGVAMRLFGGA